METFLDTQHSPGLEGNACHGPGHVPLQSLISQLTFIFPSSKSHIPPPNTPPAITESNEIQMGQRKALDVEGPLPETAPICSSRVSATSPRPCSPCLWNTLPSEITRPHTAQMTRSHGPWGNAHTPSLASKPPYPTGFHDKQRGAVPSLGGVGSPGDTCLSRLRLGPPKGQKGQPRGCGARPAGEEAGGR